MRAPWRLAVATGIVSMMGTGLYACGSTDGGGVPNENGTGHPATPAGGEGGTTDPPVAPEASVGVDTYVPPSACTILESDAGTLPPLDPPACKSCVASKCCAQMTKCYGSAPADAGLDGSNGKKTLCQLAGECETNCNGDALCEAQCGITYGENSAADFDSAESCITDPAPAGCADFCN
jgi:hypothetical protein